MKSLFISVLIICVFIASSGSASPAITEQQREPSRKPVTEKASGQRSAFDVPLNVTALTLSHNKISFVCPEDSTNCTPSPEISISVTAPEPENVVLVYLYKISVGKIIGSGPNVVWDLSNVEPGTYTITAAVDFEGNPWKRPLGTTQTKEITITEKIERNEDNKKSKDLLNLSPSSPRLPPKLKQIG